MKLGLLITPPILAGLLLAESALAVPAKPGYFYVDTPDGQIKVRLAGDEHYHQYFSEDGYPVVEKDGLFYYCDLSSSGELIETGLKIGDESAAAADYKSKFNFNGLEKRIERRADRSRQSNRIAPEKHIRTVSPASGTMAESPYPQGYGLYPLSKGSRFPSSGRQKGLVILVEYNDVPFTLENPHDYFSRMLNEPGFSDYGATGSAVDYFRYNSMDAFQPEFDVYGPVKLTKNRSYYGANDPWGNDLRPHQMMIEALDALDPEVDFSQYDCDGDGYIDNVFIFYAGRGEASGGGAVTVWPHANTLSNLNEKGHVYDGVTADRYGCTNEWMGTRPDGVGTFIHEFSHVMGLPDLYATSYANSFTPDSWSAMDHGSYNNDGMTPPLYSMFERYALGWVKPNEINRPVTATLQPIGNNMGGIIRSDRSTEYFLIENRQPTGWDSYLPGHGMLVWHIDYNENIWFNNTVNNTPSHQYVDLIEADNIRTDETRSGDSFPGSSNITSFTSTTSPSMTTWAGSDLDFPITNIRESEDGLITFDVLGGASTDLPAVDGIKAEDITANGFTLKWNQCEGLDHLVSVYTRGEDGAVDYVAPYHYYNAGDTASLEVKGLNSTQKYFVTVVTSNGWEMGEVSGEVSLTTDRMNLSYYQVIADEADAITPDGFTARWTALEGANGYEVELYKQEEAGQNEETCDFEGGAGNLPDGWKSSSSATYSMGSYCGAAAPSLRLGEAGDWLETSAKDDDITSVSFWHRGNGVKEGASIEIEAFDGNEYKKVKDIPVVTVSGGESNVITLPEGTKQVKLVFVNPEGKGSVAIDDVILLYGMNYKYLPFAGYELTDAGLSTQHTFKGLPESTTFGYTVKGYDDDYKSMPSEMKFVMTGKTSGVSLPTGNTSDVYVIDRKIVNSAATEIVVYDIAGRRIAASRENIILPSAGVYIIYTPSAGKSVKINVK
ncbi:MAG: M6 family metalloprotease domain-containing protein [Bacteroidales bacterium]|nr:M6 family metalloprotease domain-containing protein [Bacteroidales bacterium]